MASVILEDLYIQDYKNVITLRCSENDRQEVAMVIQRGASVLINTYVSIEQIAELKNAIDEILSLK